MAFQRAYAVSPGMVLNEVYCPSCSCKNQEPVKNPLINANIYIVLRCEVFFMLFLETGSEVKPRCQCKHIT